MNRNHIVRQSLLNDATALLIYRGQVAAVAGSFALSSAAPMLALSTLGSLLAGYGLTRLFHLVLARVRDPASGTITRSALGNEAAPLRRPSEP
jgi:NhaP-type Na+/H+ or K+/H+ antiporter